MRKNTSNRLLPFFMLLLLPLVFVGQKEMTVHLNWEGIRSQQTVRGLSVNYLSFEGATNLYEFGALPVYSFSMPSPGEFLNYELSFSGIVADTVPEEVATTLTDIDMVRSEIQYRLVRNNDGFKLFILPFSLSEDKSILLKLNNFNVLVDIVPAEDHLKKPVSAVNYSGESVLNTGTWFKLGIVNTGIHKLSYADLQKMGLDPGQIAPDQLGIFGNYSGMLPEYNGDPRLDDLQENTIFVSGAEDGKFDEGDYVLFYAKSAVHWRYNIFTGRFDHRNNLYADTTFYFFTPDKGNNKRISTTNSSEQSPSETIDSYYDFAAHERDLENLVYSGKDWFGERLSLDTSERTFTFHFPGLKTDQPVYMNFEMVIRAYENTYYRIFVNDEIVIDSTRILAINNNGAYARETKKKITFFADSEDLEVKVKYYTNLGTSIAWIDFIELNVEKELRFDGGQMGFRDPHTAAAGNITRFNFSGAPESSTVWDISDFHNPVNVNYVMEDDGSMHFTLPTDTIRDFIIFDETSAYSPVVTETVANQNLHGISQVNLVVVSPGIFLDQARRYANIHRELDGMTVEVVSLDQVYNEFSSGSQDVSAIRDFMRMLWKKGAFGGESGFLALFGDGSFDYKYRVRDNTNMVPTYQSDNSLILTKSFATDDYFGLLDDDEGLNASGILDIGVGRFPVSTKEQAKTAIDKLEHYLSRNAAVMRDWRNEICFVADDQDGNLHLKQASQLVNIIDTIPAWFITNKVFADAFTKVTVPGGKRYPDVSKRIKDQVENGALIVNYTGHGGLIGWAEERLLEVPTIREWKNLDNLTLFITATCEFSRFDDPEFVSAGEYAFLNEEGGAIALLSTTRLAFAAANIVINRRIYFHLMEQDKNGDYLRLGDLVRLSKNPSSPFYLNFTLLGDPALRLAYPKYNVVTTKVNNKISGEVADTVRGMSVVTVSGEIVDRSGNKIPGFNGFLYPKVFDKPSKYKTLGNDVGSYPVDFYLTDKILYAGKISIIDGSFEFTIPIPKDISYQYGFGKISYYALDTAQFVDAWGSYDELLIGGLDENAEIDDTGPEIEIYLDDHKFEPGMVTSSKPLLIAHLFDEQGIHSTGQSLGRDLALVMDKDYSNTHIVNEYFSPDVNTYQSGEVEYQLSNLSKGWHSLSLKAWDLQNNSSEEIIDFYVDDDAEILLREVLNYPNPFTETTKFGFIHNKSGTKLTVDIRIYDINGRFIGALNETVSTSGYQIQPILWNGRDQNGQEVKPGLYTYEISVTDFYGNVSVQRQKMIKLGE
ncbi:MAG: type IX secretion system sortase PorU [Bacteroidales bacterium]|nr:type IX secretion system sortase PorU [Bacteroidales bacterium]